MKLKDVLEFKAVGTKFNELAKIKDEIQITDKAEVKWEKDNKFDPMAHAIYVRGAKVGYVPKDMIQDIDPEKKFFVRRLNTYDGEVVGLNLVQLTLGE